MGYAIYHTEKGINQASLLGKHIDRHPDGRHTFFQADLTKSHLNEDFTTEPYKDMELQYAINYRINEGYKGNKAIRKDAVKYLKHILTASHEDMLEIAKEPEKLDRWIATNRLFIEREFGSENIVRFTLHMDEKTPHIHAVTVPITKDGRLSAKSIMGDVKQMRERQTRYGMAMHPFGLERGLEQSGIKHEGAKEYYARINSMADQTEQRADKFEKITEQLNDANIFNFKKKIDAFKDDLSDELKKNSLSVGSEVLKQNSNLKKQIRSLTSQLSNTKIAEGIKDLKARCTILDYFASLVSRGALRFDGKKGNEVYFALPSQKTGSIAVNEQKGLFYDHSTGKGGDVLTAMNQFENLSTMEAIRHDTFNSEAIKKSADRFYSSAKNIKGDPMKIESDFELTAETDDIKHPALISYLDERGFSPNDVKGILKEVHWQDPNKEGRRFFALGMRYRNSENDVVGYSLRNSLFKGNRGKVVPTYFSIGKSNENSDLKIFEGVFDLLAYKKMFPKKEFRAYVLGGVTQLDKLMPKIEITLEKGIKIQTYFDADTAGADSYKKLVREFPLACSNGELTDNSKPYRDLGIKDLCEYMNYKNSTTGVKKQPKKGNNGVSL